MLQFSGFYLMRLSSREVGREPLRGRILVIYYIILSLYPKQDSRFNRVNLIWNRTDPLHQHEWRAASTGPMARPDFLQYLAYYRPIWLTPLAWLSINGLHEDYKKILLSSSPDPQKVKKKFERGLKFKGKNRHKISELNFFKFIYRKCPIWIKF